MAAPDQPRPDAPNSAGETQPPAATPREAGATEPDRVDLAHASNTADVDSTAGDVESDDDVRSEAAPAIDPSPPATEGGADGDGAVPAPPRTMDPAACAAKLKALFPALFTGSPKPLKLRIQIDIQQRAPGVFSKTTLSAFFRRYTGSTGYLLAVARGKNRFDLEGQTAGELSEEHRSLAQAELTRRRANTEARVALEEQQRRNRATLLHDFERTTLTPANFCALKDIEPEALDGFLETARHEARERAQVQNAAAEHRAQRPGPHTGPGRGPATGPGTGPGPGNARGPRRERR